jgi:hypothetical protein
MFDGPAGIDRGFPRRVLENRSGSPGGQNREAGERRSAGGGLETGRPGRDGFDQFGGGIGEPPRRGRYDGDAHRQNVEL